MGIFDFLKKKKEKRIKFNQIENWSEKYMKDNSIEEIINSFKKETKTRIKEARELLKKLDGAALMNEDIPQRVKQIMEGNKKNYLRKINLFLDEIKPPKLCGEVKEFSKELSKKIDYLSKETQRSFMVLKEFVETELVTVVRKIKEIEDSAKRLNFLMKEKKLEEISKLKELFSQFHNAKETMVALKESKKKRILELEEIEKKEKKSVLDIKKLENGSEYSDYYELKKERQKIDLEIQNMKKELLTHFSTLEKAFKKYKRLSLNETLLDKYIKNPSKAIIEDEEIAISEVMDKMLLSINKLGLKDKKKEKTEEEIKKLSKELLKEKRNKLRKAIKEQSEIKDKLNKNNSLSKISEYKMKLEKRKRDIENKKAEIKELKKKIKNANPKLIKQEVKKIMEEFSVIIEDN